MRLTELTMKNYKSYLDRQVIKVDSGFNLFLGGNNSGKTTFLEALDVDFSRYLPHRSLKNSPVYGAEPTGFSMMGVRIETDLHETSHPTTRLAKLSLHHQWREGSPANSDTTQWALRLLNENPNIELQYEFGSGRQALTISSILGHCSLDNRSPAQQHEMLTLEMHDNATLLFKTINTITVGGGFNNEHAQMLERLTQSFYRFTANRRPVSACGESSHPVALVSDASNLPYCLNHLQSTDPHGHEILCEWINRVFPAVHWVQASPKPGNQFEIVCLPSPPASRRYDLAVPLDKMGSGIGNVIAMLYVVLTARAPRVIAIDEPNSFLHPKALRELLQIFATEGKMHQYLLTAHSADVITAVPPSLITLFELDGGATRTTQVSGGELVHIREELSDFGIRMTDLHGRDRVLWVEGQTEELVMPQLLQHFCPEVAPGTAVLRVEHTGLFEKKKVDPAEVAKLYQRLTSSSALVPPMVAILLDREKRSFEECQRLSAVSGDVLKFLDRTMLESYVLQPHAIAQILCDHGEDIGHEAIAAHLANVVQPGQESTIDAAKVLKDIFNEFTEARTAFQKTRDVPALVLWLLEHNREFLAPLGRFLRQVFSLPSE